MLKKHNLGDDLTIMNCFYLYPTIDDRGKGNEDDQITVVYKNNTTGKKEVREIKQPEYQFWIAKDGAVDLTHNHLFVDRDLVEPITVLYRDLEKELAERSNNLEFFYNNIRTGNRYSNRQLHKLPQFFMSDTHIEDYYRFKFDQLYQNNVCHISKGFFDIEVDGTTSIGDIPDLGECPINAISLIESETNQLYTFLLRNPNNPLVEKLEKSINEDFFRRLKIFIQNTIGGWKQEVRFELDKINYNVYFFSDEIEMIRSFFNTINTIQPDFLLAWNMAFDIPYILARIKTLGYDPEDIITHSDFKRKVARYYIDERNYNEFEERGDFATISSYTVFLDQMIQFASRRKGQTKFLSYRLDDIGYEIAKVRKLDFSYITTVFNEFPYKSYETFVLYNIIDVIVQWCIEKKTNDVNYIFSKCLSNNTRYSKGHRQTIYLVNRGTKEFYNDNLIIGNNVNIGSPKPETKFPGAYVADPQMLYNTFKVKNNGVYVNVLDNLNDFDFTSFYPMTIEQHNMAPNTIIGLIKIAQEIHKYENRTNRPTYSRGGAYIEDYTSGVFIEFAQRWLGFPGYLQLYEDILEFFRYVKSNPFILDPLYSTTNRFGESVYNNNLIPLITVYDSEDYIISNKYSYDSSVGFNIVDINNIISKIQKARYQTFKTIQ